MREVSRRRFLATLTLGGLGAALPACAPPPPPLRIASHVWPGYEFMFLARRHGELPEDQVRLLEMPSATDSLHALSAGFVDGAALTLDEVLRARADGVPLAVVAVLDISAGADMLLARPEIATLRELAGKRIGVEHSGVGTLMLDAALKASGLTPADVRRVRLPAHEQETAWLMNHIDAVVTYEPTAGRLLAHGARRLFDSRAIPESIVDVLAVREEALLTKPAACRLLVAAHFRALASWQAAPDAASAALAVRLGVAAADVPAQFKEIHLPDITTNRHLLGGSAPPLATAARKMASAMRAADLLATTDDRAGGLVRADFLPPPTP